MSQVSKRIVGKQIEQEVYDTFWSTISKLTDKLEVQSFFTDLFTQNERINFTKRLAITILLHKGFEWEHIRDLLKVSHGTIAKMATKQNSPGFVLLYKKLEREKQWKDFWHNLAKTYLITTHPDKYGRLDSEGVDKLVLGKKKTLLY